MDSAVVMAMAARLAAENARLIAQAGSQERWRRAAVQVTQRHHRRPGQARGG